MVRANSVTVFKEEVKPSLSKRQKAVLDQIQMRPGRTAKEYAEFMGVHHHTISGRFGELQKKGIIMETGTKYFNNRPHATWQVVRKSEQLSIF